ncbi:MAG TPA: ABC transporter permease, partial [Clostridia bacterium]|nr:ABC transporter permease [Clostridia bacterium]
MSGPMNWLSQVLSVTKFGLLSIPQRLGSVGASMIGIAGVVAVLVGVLSISEGFRKTLAASGSSDSAIVLRTGADSEMVSGFAREQTRLIADAPGLARGPQGALASGELFVIINLPKRSTGTDANVPLRGVEDAAFGVRDKFKIVEGRKFERGKNEVIVGVGAANQFAGLRVGEKMKVGRYEWPVVGIFSAGGGTAESEIWTDATVLQGAYNRGDTFQSVYTKLVSPSAFQQFKDSLTTDPRLSVKVMRQTDYYAEQSTAVTKLINTLGTLIAFLMALGAVFGALNTMYSAVSARTREIATLRALGFGSGSVVVAVLLESLVLALIGGAFGATIAYFAFNGF